MRKQMNARFKKQCNALAYFPLNCHLLLLLKKESISGNILSHGLIYT